MFSLAAMSQRGCWTRQPEREQGLRHSIVIVPQDVSFMQEVAGHGLNAERSYPLDIDLDGLLAFSCVLLQAKWGDRLGVDQRVVEDRRVRTAAVLQEFLDVLRGREPE